MAPKHAQLRIFIQANITVGKKLKTCQERPHLVSGRFIKVFYKTTTCIRRPLLSGPKSGRLIQVWLYKHEYASHRSNHRNVFLKISYNSQENTCATVSFLIKFAGLLQSIGDCFSSLNFFLFGKLRIRIHSFFRVLQNASSQRYNMAELSWPRHKLVLGSF